MPKRGFDRFGVLAILLLPCACRRDSGAEEVATMIPGSASSEGPVRTTGEFSACARLRQCCADVASGAPAFRSHCAGVNAADGIADHACTARLASIRLVAGSNSTALPASCEDSSLSPAVRTAVGSWSGAAFGRGRSLHVPDTRSGRFVSGDPRRPNGGLYHDYSITMSASISVTFVARGGARTGSPDPLDMYLELLDGATSVQTDDDSAGNLNSRIVFTAPRAGIYTLRVTTYGSSQIEGQYTLDVLAGALDSAH